MKTRKITYFYIERRPITGANNQPENITILREIFQYIMTLDAVRNRDMNVGEFAKKACYLESAQRTQEPIDHWRLLFLSAKIDDRRPVMNLLTKQTRPNPKDREEGEKEKNHLVMNFDLERDQGIILFEVNKNGITINNVLEYLTRFTGLYYRNLGQDRPFTLHLSKVVTEEEFIDFVNRMTRVKRITVNLDKQIIGNQNLEFSDRIQRVKSSVKLELKAERNQSIADAVPDFFRNYTNRQNTLIRSIEVEGVGEGPNRQAIINTDALGKKHTIQIDQNPETEEVSTPNAFLNLSHLLSTFIGANGA